MVRCNPLVAYKIADMLTEHGHSHSHSHGDNKKKAKSTSSPRIGETSSTSSGSVTPVDEERGRSRERSDSLFGYPAATRMAVMQEAQELRRNRSPSVPRSAPNNLTTSLKNEYAIASSNSLASDRVFSPTQEEEGEATERTPLMQSQQLTHSRNVSSDDNVAPSYANHNEGSEPSSNAPISGHSHGSMNMHAILLHVLGDALGNVGVIATGLIIWFSSLSWKFYFDPIISLVITCIIFSSALPLGKPASCFVQLSRLVSFFPSQKCILHSLARCSEWYLS